MLRLTEKYRPTRYEDVRGQDEAVGFISKASLARAPTNILICGAHGSGKTSLIRVYAAAINCTNQSSLGSPCGECASCTGSDPFLFEYDVPAKGGAAKNVMPWVEALNRPQTFGRFRVLFLDEAQGLEPSGMEALLKVAEEPASGVVFCAATTRPDTLDDVFRSRFTKLTVSALATPDAVRLLEDVARKELISFDHEALILLAAIKRGHARDLLAGLQLLASKDAFISAALVKATFDAESLDHLVTYFLELACGNREGQARALHAWREDLAIKVQWIKAMLASIYFENILCQDLVINPLVKTLTSARHAIVLRFCSRLDMTTPKSLARFWLQLMAFWSDDSGYSEADLGLRLGLFGELVNTVDSAILLPVDSNSNSNIFSLLPTSSYPNHEGPNGANDRGSLEPSDIREIVNRASFFVQQYGRLFNFSFQIYAHDGANEQRRFKADVHRFVEAIAKRCQRDIVGFFAIYTFELDENGVVCRLIGYAPVEIAPHIEHWWNAWRNDVNDSSTKLNISNKDDGIAFHWGVVQDVCASVSDHRDGPALLKSLNVPRNRWRTSALVLNNVVNFSPGMSTSWVDAVCKNHMAFLSAWDDRAWRYLRSGWELKEYGDRARLSAERGRQIDHLDRLWAGDADKLEQEKSKLLSQWPSDPRSRPRSWDAWF